MTDSVSLAVIGIPGAWSSEHLAGTASERGHGGALIDSRKLCFDSRTSALTAGDVHLTEFDGILIKKLGEPYSPDYYDRLDLLALAEQSGVRMFSPTESIRALVDRLSCTARLHAAGIPVPPTLATEDTERAVEAVADFGEVVIKPLYSTKARGMLLLNGEAPATEIRAALAEFQHAFGPMLYIQQKLELPGRDLGVVFLGGEYIGTYARVSAKGSWNTTIRAGGRYEKFEPDESLIEIARRAQAVFSPDFTTVDVAETPDGPVVFEVSAFGGFRGLREGLDIDAGQLLIDHAVRSLQG